MAKKPLDKIKIFLVDDDQMFIDLLRHSLVDKRMEISSFPTGEACLKNIHHLPHIVVLDFYLNSNVADAMNGAEVLKKIKKASPATEVIMLSSQESIEVAIETLKNGAYDYITKGKSAVIKIRNSIRHIGDRIEGSEESDKETLRLKRVNVIVVVVCLLLFLLSRIV